MIKGLEDFYKYYCNTTEDKNKVTDARLTKVRSRLANIKRVLEDNASWISSNTNITYTDIINNEVNLLAFKCNNIVITNNHLNEDSIVNYIKAYNQCTRIINKLLKLRLSNKVTYKLYTEILRRADLYVAEEVLKGNAYHLADFGLIYIKEKKRLTKSDDKNDYKVVDWGASYKYLPILAKEYYPSIYDNYIELGLNTKQLKEILNPYLYNKELNPNGHKWLIYHISDKSYWWYFNKSMGYLPNKMYYSFIPTGCNNQKLDGVPVKNSELKDKFSLDQVKDLKIGLKQKLQLYLALDPNIHLKYRYDIQNS
jgi:hypothetical protein